MKRKNHKFEFEPAFDIKKILMELAPQIEEFQHIDLTRVFCFRSLGSSSRAIARIWSLPRIWQRALSIDAHYIIEVVSERYDKLKYEEQKKVLIHEMMHIPKTFSGSLVPHRCFRKRINNKSVEKLFQKLVK